MNTKDIRTSTDPDLAGSYAAMERAARAAQDLAIKTNTGRRASKTPGSNDLCGQGRLRNRRLLETAQ